MKWAPRNTEDKDNDIFIPVIRHEETMGGGVGGAGWVVSRIGLKECGEEKISFVYRGLKTEPCIPRQVALRLERYNRNLSTGMRRITTFRSTTGRI